MKADPNTRQHPTRPENQSSPAEGGMRAEGARKVGPSCQRGVIVTPPSANTFDPYPVLHRGFDTLAVAIKANLPLKIVQILDSARCEAERERRAVVVDLDGHRLRLSDHGGVGYRFMFETAHGVRWSFKTPNPKDPWGGRVSFGSDFLAEFGLGAAKTHQDKVLALLGLAPAEKDFSFARVDYCVDILVPGFRTDPALFVMHAATGRAEILVQDKFKSHGRSGRVESVTVGSIRRRQVIIYDKRHEVIQRHKPQWWTIWNKEAVRLGIPLLAPSQKGRTIWRVEFRLGKEILKDRWECRTWADLFAKFGDVAAECAEVIRYTDPTPTDSNRARWPAHTLYATARDAMLEDLAEMQESRGPIGVKEVRRAHHIDVLSKNILGSFITVSALAGVEDAADLPTALRARTETLVEQVEADPQRIQDKLRKARERYVFLERDEGER